MRSYAKGPDLLLAGMPPHGDCSICVLRWCRGTWLITVAAAVTLEGTAIHKINHVTLTESMQLTLHWTTRMECRPDCKLRPDDASGAFQFIVISLKNSFMKGRSSLYALFTNQEVDS